MQLEKITNELSTRRRYEDACAAAHALDLVGERWALLVMRELMLGPRRFSDLRAGLPGISANVLTQRLEWLEATGIVMRRRLPPPASIQVYELTPWGYESEPVFRVLGRWAARSPFHDPTLPFSAASLILSFRTMFEPLRAGGISVRVGLWVGGEEYMVRIAEGRMSAAREALDQPDLILTGDAASVAAFIYGGQPLAGLEAAGALRVEGDRALAEKLPALFPLPPKLEVPTPSGTP